LTTWARAQGRAGFNYTFLTQKERDNETGLDYFGARYYASTQGRFTSADSWAGRMFNPQSLNRYSYFRNNPLKFVDPSGHQGEEPQRKKGKKGEFDDEFGNTPDTPEIVVVNSEPCNCRSKPHRSSTSTNLASTIMGMLSPNPIIFSVQAIPGSWGARHPWAADPYAAVGGGIVEEGAEAAGELFRESSAGFSQRRLWRSLL
jgi:RHS repeat-associated protein